MIIDYHSSLLIDQVVFYNNNAFIFQKVVINAIDTYVIHDKLFVDNGCSYSNELLSIICVSFGILLLHTIVFDGASIGKIYRHLRTVKECLLYNT